MDNFNGNSFGSRLHKQRSRMLHFNQRNLHLPELHGASHATFDTPHMFVPDKASIITDHEVRLLDEITTAPVKQLNAVKSQVMASQQTLDVDSLLHAHYTSLHRERVILALGNYYVPMCGCSSHHSLLLLTFLFMPQIFTLFFSAHTSNPKR